MSFDIGNKIKYTVFGQSHSEAIGIVIEGLPAGFKPDQEKIAEFMARRAPGRNSFSTPRKEADAVKFLSGLNENGELCGAPLCMVIENTNTKSQDYKNLRMNPRPGHSDFPAYIKFGGFNDIRGGGQFSGRLTAPLCAAGAIAKEILAEKGVFIGAHISSVHGLNDSSFNPLGESKEVFEEIAAKEFPVISDRQGELMKEEIEKARRSKDSVGGIIECMISGLAPGLGSDKTDSIESRLSSMIFSIPAVKGIEFGAGFKAAELYGSENNDEFYFDGDTVKTRTNNHGGILGGISSGMPIVFRAVIKPTSSIGRLQKTINLETMTETDLEIKGRHDPCIVQRAVPVTEACAALVVLDLL